MFWRITIMSLVGASIGWFTNYLAIKMIFRPLKPVRIPIIGIEFHGLVPKRRHEIAVSIGKTVEEQLLSMDDLLEHLNSGKNHAAIIKNLRIGILKVINDKLPSMTPRIIKDSILRYIGDVIEKESKEFINNNMENLIRDAVDNINVGELVEEKINNFDLIELETIILSLSKNELKYIEILGGVLGFIIGLIQGLFMNLFI